MPPEVLVPRALVFYSTVYQSLLYTELLSPIVLYASQNSRVHTELLYSTALYISQSCTQCLSPTVQSVLYSTAPVFYSTVYQSVLQSVHKAHVSFSTVYQSAMHTEPLTSTVLYTTRRCSESSDIIKTTQRFICVEHELYAKNIVQSVTFPTKVKGNIPISL